MTDLTLKKKRYFWINIYPWNLPIPGWVSFGHRVSGVLLFAGLYWLLALLERSLASGDTFEAYKATVSHPFAKLCLIVLAWSYLHHFCAGLRYLFMDVHWGADLASARKSAVAVFVVSILLTLVFAVAIW